MALDRILEFTIFDLLFTIWEDEKREKIVLTGWGVLDIIDCRFCRLFLMRMWAAMVKMKTRLKTVAVLYLLGIPFYILCYEWHICMAGHMEHGPYSLYEWVNDFLWIICFAAVLIFSLRLRAKRRMWFICGSILLILSRIPMGSAGGSNIIFELPLLIVIVVFAIKYLVKPERYIISGEQSDAADTDVSAS